MIASESVALSFMGYEIVRNVDAGEVVFIDMKGKVHTAHARRSRCAPLHVRVGLLRLARKRDRRVPVYGSRIQLGKNLARLVEKQIEARGLEADLIVPIPETSRIAAIALAEELGIPYREVLIKNRYIKRTFILDSQEKRQNAVNLKLSPVKSEIKGKRVLLIDDSIVRGTTSRKIIELVRKAGATKVYIVSTCPPIQHPCYYGIDFPSEKELIASKRDLRPRSSASWVRTPSFIRISKGCRPRSIRQVSSKRRKPQDQAVHGLSGRQISHGCRQGRRALRGRPRSGSQRRETA